VDLFKTISLDSYVEKKEVKNKFDAIYDNAVDVINEKEILMNFFSGTVSEGTLFKTKEEKKEEGRSFSCSPEENAIKCLEDLQIGENVAKTKRLKKLLDNMEDLDPWRV